MVRNLKFQVLVGGFAFLFTFLISVGNNTLMTSLSRSAIGFLIFFFIMFPVQWFFIMSPKSVKDDEVKGTNINIQTPDDDLAKEVVLNSEYNKQVEESQGFTPLSPPVLKKKQEPSESMNSEDIANAIRVLSNQ